VQELSWQRLYKNILVVSIENALRGYSLISTKVGKQYGF